ncbi:hypothetical protein HPB52_012699 [Rhipicephalus sanguineus]|uniref:Uncharacterized protein n=1 Tax=Rhipicephalus sanguineus TaxID=34632 RepID=A0A9D4SP41_RHISA|nr:hypothetical protein HPB52_012699 [Rhipicephalus sanguineus]
MELLSEFGDPQVLSIAEDHIALKLETAWPRDMVVPEGLSLDNDDHLLLVANQKSLISAATSALPRGVRIWKALFCGCASFEASERYRNAASKLLRDTHEICIMHNRDKVYNLVGMFPNARVLALPHDLSLPHFLEVDEPCRDPSVPFVEGSKLKELVGYSNRDFVLLLSLRTTLALLRTCPDLRRIECRWVANVILEQEHSFPALADRPRATNITHLCLMSRDLGLGVELPGGIGGVDVAKAANKFPSVAHLQKLLTNLPDLEDLALESCGGIRLSTMARLCPKLKRLRLASCMGTEEDTPVDHGAFANLDCVEMEVLLLKVVFNSFLRVTRYTLRIARFGGDGTCSEFLHYCAHYGQQFPFVNLERLTLTTDKPLRSLELEPRDLHHVAKSLPKLRHLQTDSYDLRLFFENCVTRGRVSLSWVGCVYCATNDTNVAMDDRITELFRDTYVPPK